jgi:hypothetical protein
MTTITLPPLPKRETDGLRHWWTADQLRARDLEVAKAVLEGASLACVHLAQADAVAHLLSKIEVKHHE